MHISITGKLGSGKSTVCHLIEKEYGFEIFSTGSIQREAARQKGVSTLELNRMMQNDCSLDYIIDDTVNRLSRERKEDKLIFDSRMAWHFAQESFKDETKELLELQLQGFSECGSVDCRRARDGKSARL